KIDLVENWFCVKIPFFLNFFFFVFPGAFENYWEIQKFCYRIPPKFEFKALFQHVTQTQTQKKKHNIVK
ncbi:Uncharacterized protein FWK35_00026707, partial [Aphis craccivora]